MLSFYVIETFMKHKNKRKILKREKGGKNQLKDCPITRIDIFDFLLCYICSCQVQQSKAICIRTLFSIDIKIGLYFFSCYFLRIIYLWKSSYLIIDSKITNILLLISILFKIYHIWLTNIKGKIQQWGSNTRHFYDYFYSFTLQFHTDMHWKWIYA